MLGYPLEIRDVITVLGGKLIYVVNVVDFVCVFVSYVIFYSKSNKGFPII